MALHDEINIEILLGNIPFRFKISDLKNKLDPSNGDRYIVGDSSYAKNSINVIPWNYSITPDGNEEGNYVRRGLSPKYYRFPDGTFELILTQQHLIKSNIVEDNEGPDDQSETLLSSGTFINKAKSKVAANSQLNSINDPVDLIIRYLESVPFQKRFKRGNFLHPENPVKGWSDRLNAYFWPNRGNDLKSNSAKLIDFSKRLESLEERNFLKDNKTNELLYIFSEICVWGNVKLPETNADNLRKEVVTTLNSLDTNTIPETRLNSTWTKLYAFLRPENFIIFDSRVANAILSILDPYMLNLSKSAQWELYKSIGKVPGRGGSRPKLYEWKWPDGYTKWKAQLDANKLILEILKRLNSDIEQKNPFTGNNHRWTLREIECVLFMEGY